MSIRKELIKIYPYFAISYLYGGKKIARDLLLSLLFELFFCNVLKISKEKIAAIKCLHFDLKNKQHRILCLE